MLFFYCADIYFLILKCYFFGIQSLSFEMNNTFKIAVVINAYIILAIMNELKKKCQQNVFINNK